MVQDISRKLGKTPAQVLLRWGLQHGTSVIPRSGSEGHQKVGRHSVACCHAQSRPRSQMLVARRRCSASDPSPVWPLPTSAEHVNPALAWLPCCPRAPI